MLDIAGDISLILATDTSAQSRLGEVSLGSEVVFSLDKPSDANVSDHMIGSAPTASAQLGSIASIHPASLTEAVLDPDDDHPGSSLELGTPAG